MLTHILFEVFAACLMLVATGEQLDCTPAPPPIHEVCVSLTNYWPFDDSGELAPLNGQADSTPQYTAVMHELTSPDIDRWSLVAGPASLLGKTVCVGYYGCYPVLDTFGTIVYRQGVFWHDGYGQWVIGVDVLTDAPIHELVCNWFVVED